jgi:hypothetical protein
MLGDGARPAERNGPEGGVGAAPELPERAYGVAPAEPGRPAADAVGRPAGGGKQRRKKLLGKALAVCRYNKDGPRKGYLGCMQRAAFSHLQGDRLFDFLIVKPRKNAAHV